MQSDPIDLPDLLDRQNQAAKRWNRRLTWRSKAKISLLGLVFIFTFIVLPWLFFFEWLGMQEKSYYLVVIIAIGGIVLIGPLDRMAQQYRLRQLIQRLNDFVVLDEPCFYGKTDAADRSWHEVANRIFGQSVIELLDEFSPNPAIRKFHLESPLPFTEISSNYFFTLEYGYEQKQWDQKLT
jgi:hypothetical protein